MNMRDARPRFILSRSSSLLALFLILTLTLGAQQPSPLAGRFETLISSGEMGETFWGIDIRDVETGEQLYGHNAESIMLPASTNKLLTAATALDALGSDFRYRTTLYYTGEVSEEGVLNGDLIIQGSGDPTFGSSAMPPGSDPLNQWADRLAELGIQRVNGRLIGIDDTFSDDPYAVGWDVDYLTDQASSWLGISTSGLSYNDNIIEVRVTSGGAGDKPNIAMSPSDYLDIQNRASTRRVSRGASIELNRNLSNLDAETFSLNGWVSSHYDGTFQKPVHNPTLFTMHAFRSHLREAGIEVSASVHDADVLPEKPNLENANPLLVHFSPMLVDILEVMNHESNNFYAEQVFRTFSPNGTLQGAARRVKALLRQAGVADAEALSIRDGSGLSRKDLVSPVAMTQMLGYMRTSHSEAQAFLSTLARGGEAQSTLQYRLRGLPIQAKTGSLAFVRALSGYAELSDGRTVSFALLANNYTVPSYQVSQTIDRIVVALTSTPIG